ncbi:hypothetical protein KC669_03105 [Candidatus Dojkabacteria bacterium]|uniref:N-end rule aminoacyl transferase C-terminal domain-containing protein n=1 Tax=Candidatus Dojkabacteria bacterium TaxID=2099670 RepID=A0A955RM51_9BACT|nr:hypothetical protein [Candidatus Dojkabacteria bacterium]
MSYFVTDTKTVDFNDAEITSAYSEGYVLTRLGKGEMNQTRSLRINLSSFEFTSENRRILRKTEKLNFEVIGLPYTDYTWEIHKLGKEYYERKFGEGVMSASKIKDMFNSVEEENMTHTIAYKYDNKNIGYCLIYKNTEIMHYAYPFYNLDLGISNLGMGMMIRAIQYAKNEGLQYIYLGSVVDPESKYKLQFNNLEWFDTDKKNWTNDINELKLLLS